MITHSTVLSLSVALLSALVVVVAAEPEVHLLLDDMLAITSSRTSLAGVRIFADASAGPSCSAQGACNGKYMMTNNFGVSIMVMSATDTTAAQDPGSSPDMRKAAPSVGSIYKNGETFGVQGSSWTIQVVDLDSTGSKASTVYEQFTMQIAPDNSSGPGCHGPQIVSNSVISGCQLGSTQGLDTWPYFLYDNSHSSFNDCSADHTCNYCDYAKVYKGYILQYGADGTGFQPKSCNAWPIQGQNWYADYNGSSVSLDSTSSILRISVKKGNSNTGSRVWLSSGPGAGETFGTWQIDVLTNAPVKSTVETFYLAERPNLTPGSANYRDGQQSSDGKCATGPQGSCFLEIDILETTWCGDHIDGIAGHTGPDDFSQFSTNAFVYPFEDINGGNHCSQSKAKASVLNKWITVGAVVTPTTVTYYSYFTDTKEQIDLFTYPSTGKYVKDYQAYMVSGHPGGPSKVQLYPYIAVWTADLKSQFPKVIAGPPLADSTTQYRNYVYSSSQTTASLPLAPMQ